MLDLRPDFQFPGQTLKLRPQVNYSQLLEENTYENNSDAVLLGPVCFELLHSYQGSEHGAAGSTWNLPRWTSPNTPEATLAPDFILKRI